MGLRGHGMLEPPRSTRRPTISPAREQAKPEALRVDRRRQPKRRICDPGPTSLRHCVRRNACTIKHHHACTRSLPKQCLSVRVSERERPINRSIENGSPWRPDLVEQEGRRRYFKLNVMLSKIPYLCHRHEDIRVIKFLLIRSSS
uniref:Uncharacterized protein n=2 Tax=Anopheles culicifacies TaxID=139723 RepID=A0A182MUY4_9DIPT